MAPAGGQVEGGDHVPRGGRGCRWLAVARVSLGSPGPSGGGVAGSTARTRPRTAHARLAAGGRRLQERFSDERKPRRIQEVEAVSDHLAGESQRPVTGAGVLVSRFLISGDRRHAVLLLLHPCAFRKLISQVWVLAMRRSFARDESERRVFEYLNGVVARAGKPVPAQRIVEIIGLSLENSPTASRSAKRHVLPVLSDLIRREFQGDEQRAELVRPKSGSTGEAARIVCGPCAVGEQDSSPRLG